MYVCVYITFTFVSIYFFIMSKNMIYEDDTIQDIQHDLQVNSYRYAFGDQVTFVCIHITELCCMTHFH